MLIEKAKLLGRNGMVGVQGVLEAAHLVVDHVVHPVD